MFDAKALLGSLLQGQARPSTASRFDTAATSAAPAQQSQGGMGTMTVGGLGALAGALLGKSGPGMLGGGLIAIVGNIAVKALQTHLAGGSTQAAAPMPVAGDGGTLSDAEGQRKARLLIRAMIQSAKADGTVDPVETQRIMGKLDEHGHDPAARAFVETEMAKSIDLPGLCRDVSSPQEAGEVYAASVMVLDLDSQPERNYLADLARNLGLAPQVTAQIHTALGVA